VEGARRITIAAADVVFTVPIDVAWSIRSRIAVLIVACRVAHFLPAGKAVRIAIVAVIATTPH
jgi:hypothetical protein